MPGRRAIIFRSLRSFSDNMFTIRMIQPICQLATGGYLNGPRLVHWMFWSGLSGSSSYGKLTESVYDTALFFPNQRFASRSRHTYKHGWINDDVFVWTQRKLSGRTTRLFAIYITSSSVEPAQKNSDLVILWAHVFFNDYQSWPSDFAANYDGFMIQDGVKPAIHLWDQALSAGHYTTLLATALPEPDKYLPEKNYRILYVDTEAASIEGALKQVVSF